MKYWTATLNVPAVVKPQMDEIATGAALTTFGELLKTLDFIPGKWQMLQGTSQ